MANFLRTMGRKELLAPHLNGWFNAGQFPSTIDFSIRLHKEPDDAFHPSSDAALCATELYAKRMGHLEKRPFDQNSYKAFMAGHFWHEAIQYILVEELGFTKPEDVEKERWAYRHESGGFFMNVDGGPPLLPTPVQAPWLWWARGFIDIAHCQIPGRGDYLVDIKTMGSHSYRLDRPARALWDKYFAQMQCYLDWEDQQTCILLCVEKDSPHRFKEFLIERDPAFIEGVYVRWDAVARAMKDGSPPPCDMEHECSVGNLYVPADST